MLYVGTCVRLVSSSLCILSASVFVVWVSLLTCAPFNQFWHDTQNSRFYVSESVLIVNTYIHWRALLVIWGLFRGPPGLPQGSVLGPSPVRRRRLGRPPSSLVADALSRSVDQTPTPRGQPRVRRAASPCSSPPPPSDSHRSNIVERRRIDPRIDNNGQLDRVTNRPDEQGPVDFCCGGELIRWRCNMMLKEGQDEAYCVIFTSSNHVPTNYAWCMAKFIVKKKTFRSCHIGWSTNLDAI